MTTHAPSLDLLLQRNRWVRALARGLVADEHLAEDLVQEAAVVSMQAQAPSRPGPWLHGILRNLAANRRRRSSRRARAETHAAQPERVSSAADSAAFVEQQRLLAEAVLTAARRGRDDSGPPGALAGERSRRACRR